MSEPDGNGNSSDSPTRAWGDSSSEETQILRPQSGSSPVGGSSAVSGGAPSVEPADSDRSDAPSNTPAADSKSNRPPVDAPTARPHPASGGAEPGSWAPYSDQPSYSSDSTMTSVYPQTPPGYAPAGHPPEYAPATVVAAPPVAASPEQTSNRVGPAFICIIAGILLTAGGLLLAGRYGIAAENNLTHNSVVIKNSGLTTLGTILLLGAVVLNGWSPWATVIPGIVLTAVGGWSLYDTRATVTVGRWTNSVLTTNQLTVWHHYGVTLAIGLMMLAASAAAAMARASGKRDGQILGRRQIS